MAGEITTLIGAIMAIADAIRTLTHTYAHARGRGKAKIIPPVLLILGFALIILGLLGISGAEKLSFLP